MTARRRRSPLGAMTLGGSVTIVCILTGAMAVQLMDELSFGSAGLGVAVAMWRATGAAMSPVLGKLCDRLGAIQSIRLSAAIATVSAFGIAVTADRFATLIAWLMVGGCGHALGQPAANRLLANVVRTGRLGTAFGIKQSAPPAASMIAGICVPLIALTLGWRWAYALAGILVLVVIAAAGRRAPRAERANARAAPGPLENRRIVVLLAIAFGLGTFTSSAITTFYVDATVRGGGTPQFAGTMLAVASIAAIASRVACGMASDRIRHGHLRLCAGLLATGSVGIGMLAIGTPTWMTLGALVGLAGTWGFNGVFWHAMIRAFPRSPGRITGALAPGALLGSTAGPIFFGVTVEITTYSVAWSAVGVVALIAAAAMILGERQLPRPAPMPLSGSGPTPSLRARGDHHELHEPTGGST